MIPKERREKLYYRSEKQRFHRNGVPFLVTVLRNGYTGQVAKICASSQPNSIDGEAQVSIVNTLEQHSADHDHQGEKKWILLVIGWYPTGAIHLENVESSDAKASNENSTTPRQHTSVKEP